MLVSKSCLNFIAGIAALTFAGSAQAEQGEVVLASSCDNFIVETSSGYTLLEWYGGPSPDEGDHVFGDLYGYGMKTIYIDGRGETRVWIEDYMAGSDAAKDFYYSKCGD